MHKVQVWEAEASWVPPLHPCPLKKLKVALQDVVASLPLATMRMRNTQVSVCRAVCCLGMSVHPPSSLRYHGPCAALTAEAQSSGHRPVPTFHPLVPIPISCSSDQFHVRNMPNTLHAHTPCSGAEEKGGHGQKWVQLHVHLHNTYITSTTRSADNRQSTLALAVELGR